MANIARQGKNVIKAHLDHLKEHGETEYLKQAVSYLKEKNIENWLGSIKKLENATFYQKQVEDGINWTNKITGKTCWQKYVQDIENLIDQCID